MSAMCSGEVSVLIALNVWEMLSVSEPNTSLSRVFTFQEARLERFHYDFGKFLNYVLTLGQFL